MKGHSLAHDSAIKHTKGLATYIDDVPTTSNCMHIAFTLSKVAYGKINAINISVAKEYQGVADVLLAKDIKHLNIGAIINDEPLLGQDEVLFYGQALCVVLADSYENARKAASLVQVDITPLTPILTVDDAVASNSFLKEPIVMRVGDSKKAIKNATNLLTGSFEIGGQEHFYLESQASLVVPSEDNNITIHSSTQNPTEVQHLVADVLGISQNNVNVVVRRMGGGFGGKETQSSQIACLAAIFAKKYNTPVKARLPRTEDMLMTGKRHDMVARYSVAYDNSGLLEAVEIDFLAKCGYSLDLSNSIVWRTLFHADNSYYIPNALFKGFLCKTNTVSNTAFRGFGGPQGVITIENILEQIANTLKIDALEVRKRNLYQKQYNNTTPYGQIITDNIINELVDQLQLNSDYTQRRKLVNEFNNTHKYVKKGLALSPVKFGISFTTTFLNQAGALVNIYKDGSICINHGGTEMGQGLHIKMAQIVAFEFGIDIATIKISSTSTDKVPNTSPTAASSGSDMNGMALQIACTRIKNNLLAFAQEHFNNKNCELLFRQNRVIFADISMPFNEFIALAYFNRTELFSNGYYKTPDIHYDEKTAKGRPFYYYAYGAAVSEVVVDVFSGEYKLIAVDILHDAGSSLNPAIDKGQIIGGFIQGMGWLCSEQLKWDSNGVLLTTGASTYKIPAIGDTPQHFKVDIMENVSNVEDTIYKSKAVGEPPLMLATSVWLAIKNAIFNSSDNNKANSLNAPASFEEVFFKLNNFK